MTHSADPHSAGRAPARPTVSLELFPPRPGRAAPATWSRIDSLLATAPDFVSVTYRPTFVTDAAGQGAVGVRVVNEPNPAEQVVEHVLGTSTVPLMAHLTCIGYRRSDVVEIVTHFLGMGVRRFLALRGDPPAGTAPDQVAGELPHADDLVRVIREVEAEYFGDGRRHVTVAVAAYPVTTGTAPDQVAGELPHADDLVRVIREVEAEYFGDGRRHVTVAVAAYPVTTDHAQAIEVLAAKQAAGADLAITQVFYDAEDYAALCRAASYAGVTMPVLPGLIPLTDLGRLTRLESLTGVPVPPTLA